jgi:Secretion system C-terminal sorting domain
MKRIYLGLVISLFAAFVFAQSHELVYWTAENTATYSYPQSGTGLADEIASASQNYSGLDTYDDNRNVWTNSSTATSITFSSSSYLSFSLDLNEAITVDRFVIHGAAPYPNAGVAMQLRCSVDNFTTSLGNFTPGGMTYNLTSVDLSGAGVIVKGEVEFRVYYYSVSSNIYHSDTGPYTSLDGTPESYTGSGRCFSIWGASTSIEELAYWSNENTSTFTYPQTASGMSSMLGAAVQDYSGLTTNNDSRNIWTNPSDASAVDPLSSPYLSYRLSLNEVITFDRFVVHGAAPYPVLGVSMQLRWSGDNFASSLGDFTPGKSDYNLTSVDLSNTELIGVNEVEFRIYFYSVAGSIYFSGTGPYTTTDGTLPFYTEYGRAFSVFGEKSCHTTSVLEVTECEGYISPSGRYTWTSSGTYRDTIPNSVGCDSLMTIDLIINTVETAVLQSGDTLSSGAEGALYQWINCDTNLPVADEISQTFIAQANGNYAVEVIQNGCTDTSACFAISTVGIAEPGFGRSFLVYPNPTHGSLKINLGENYSLIFAKIIGMDGQVISHGEYNDTDQIELSIDTAPGMYFIELSEPSRGKVVLKLIKE